MLSERRTFMTQREDRFAESARRVLQLAQEEAQRLNNNFIGTEHLLLGIMRDEQGIGARVINEMGADLAKIRSSVESIIVRGKTPLAGDMGLTPRSKKIIELAVEEAQRLKHPYVGAEHLLLGLIHEGGGIAAGVLESLNIDLAKVRLEVIRQLNKDTK